ncbi:NADPH-cytochrome P450 reductase [Cladophialophora chaetospira]|uniref:NADPH--cytochrome P450 reductase n=1 Tax=Cladophialophora chaetospira TaxID=386627 RepID=A0AA38XGY9_9EURO|nr:NADPH-cytochrome P450 reductase [Cladophialophora chaetospira]
MQILGHWDLLLIKASLAGICASYVGSKLQRALRARNSTTGLNLHSVTSIKRDTGPSLAPTRSPKKRLEQADKRCIIFYGTQTGTAEKFAMVMARELTARFNLPSMIADLDDYDYIDLSSMLPNQLAIFILATYGEGEPTDNAISFESFLRQQTVQVEDQEVKSMPSLRYAAFGLGSSSYPLFNAMVTKVDDALQRCGATRVGMVGRGDDSKGTCEADFVNWKETTLSDIATCFNLKQVEYKFQPIFTILEESSRESVEVYLGEPNKNHLNGRICGPFTARNPFPAKILVARELFTSSERNCLHLEFDISDTTMTYETGDHLAVWPVNSDLEVERFLKVLNLFDKRETIINITNIDPTIKAPIPSKTTYEAAARYYLDICAPVSQQSLAILATVASGSAQHALQTLGTDQALFQIEVSDKLLNLAQTLEMIGATTTCSTVPFSFFLENISKLQPRYYSISSSSLASSKKISITAVVESSVAPGSDVPFKGVSTNYLLALKRHACGLREGSTIFPTHILSGPRGRYNQPTALINVRRSKFRLPRSSGTPVIMVGPGTGVAPFRGFVQERALQARSGRTGGRTILFYGCRNKDEDYLYKDEWDSYSSSSNNGEFSIYTAFSREHPGRRVYVQDVIRTRAGELKELILNQNAHVYVCGDATRMAKDVFKTFEDIMDGCVPGSSHDYLKVLKASGRWSEDVW